MAPPKGFISHAGRMFHIDPELDSKRVGADVYPLMSGPNAPAGAVVVVPLAREAIHLGKPYPIKALWCAGGNPVVSMQNVRDVWQMLKEDLDLFVVSDHFMTPSAELADYVLPAIMWMEADRPAAAITWVTSQQDKKRWNHWANAETILICQLTW